jgi:HK97 family phage major capsid protein
MNIKEITDEIGALYEKMKAMVQGATDSGTPMNPELEVEYEAKNKRLTDLIKLRDQHYGLLDAQAKAVSNRREAIGEIAESRQLSTKRTTQLENTLNGEEYRSAFLRFLSVGANGMNSNEIRAMSEGTDGNGGYLPSQDFYAQLIKKRFLTNAMRQICTVMPLGTFKTQITVENALGTASYNADSAGLSDSTPTFSTITLQPQTLSFFTKVSNELIEDSPSRGQGFSIESILADQMGRTMGLAEESNFVKGAGSGSYQPLGALTASQAGSTVTLAAAAIGSQVITIQKLIDVVYALPRQYRANAKWIMGDALFAKIRAITQTAGTTAGYAPQAWSMGDGRIEGGEPDRLLGFPVVCVADAPAYALSTIQAGFGDYSYYMIGERSSISIKVAREAYLANNQTGYFAFARNDGKMTLPTAQVHLATGAAS